MKKSQALALITSAATSVVLSAYVPGAASAESLSAPTAVDTRPCSAVTGYSPVTSDSSESVVHAQISQAICNMRTVRTGLGKRIGHKHNLQTAFDSTVIGLGIASVAATGFGAAPIVVGGIALGGLGLQSYRDYYAPEKQGGQLLLAMQATRCVASKAEPLLNISPAAYWQAMRQLRAAVANVNATSAVLTSSSQADIDGRNAAKQAVAAAESTFAALLAEAEAYNNATSVIDQAHDSVNNFIDKTEHRGSVNFSDIQSQLTTSFAAQAQAVSQIETAKAQLFGAFSAQATAQGSAANPAMAGQPAAPAALMSASPAGLASAALVSPAVAAASSSIGLAADLAVSAAPTSLNAAQVVQSPTTNVASGAAAISGTSSADDLNARAVAVLNDQSEQALKLTPTAQITTVNTAITGCVNSLAN